MAKIMCRSFCFIKSHNRLGVVLLALLLPILFTTLLVQGANSTSETPSGTITVCPGGPPLCDFATIQAGIDSAEAGDNVLVSSGIYTENLVLRDGIRIESEEGPDSTIVTALQGPIISGTSVSSVFILGIGVSGLETLFPTTGIELIDSEATLSEMVISDFSAYDGHEFHPDGWGASGVRATGVVSLTILDSRVQNLVAGDGWVNGYGAVGGDATSVWVNGAGTVRVISTTVDGLSGGAAGSYGLSCDGRGGSAMGIHVEGGADLNVSNSEIMNLRGGAPCNADPYPACSTGAGSAIGIDSQQGTAVLNSNFISNLVLVPSYDAEPSFGIRTISTIGSYLDQNTIQGGSGASRKDVYATTGQMMSPWCSAPGARFIAVGSEDDHHLQVTSNTITGLHTGGAGGLITGLYVRNGSSMNLSHNTIENLSGGYGGWSAVGAYIVDSNTVEIEANRINNLSGADGPTEVYYLSSGFNGGSSLGIFLADVSSATVFNNNIASISGGDGGQSGFSGGGRAGGNAIAIEANGSTMKIMNNTMVNAQAGAGGQWYPPGSPGTAAGVRAGSGADVNTFNNALVNLGIGIFSSNSALLTSDYNDFWANSLDYDGVLPGSHDLYVYPAWASARYHLGSSSPLIDAGTNFGAPVNDLDEEPRPLDGDGDSVAITDIGSDEYCLGICIASKSAEPHVIRAGDEITYAIYMHNSQLSPFSGGLTLSDTLSLLTTYVEGSLSATSGDVSYISGTIHWTGTIPAGGSLSIVFQVSTDPDFPGPYIVPNQAAITGDSSQTQYVSAMVWVEPVQLHLPLITMHAVQ